MEDILKTGMLSALGPKRIDPQCMDPKCIVSYRLAMLTRGERRERDLLYKEERKSRETKPYVYRFVAVNPRTPQATVVRYCSISFDGYDSLAIPCECRGSYTRGPLW